MERISRVPMYLGMGASIGGAGLICTSYPTQSWFFTLVLSLCITVTVVDRYCAWRKRKELIKRIYKGGTND